MLVLRDLEVFCTLRSRVSSPPPLASSGQHVLGRDVFVLAVGETLFEVPGGQA